VVLHTGTKVIVNKDCDASKCIKMLQNSSC